ncbi:MAG: hypothetical protein ACRDH5_10465, partial [bacterium]
MRRRATVAQRQASVLTSVALIGIVIVPVAALGPVGSPSPPDCPGYRVVEGLGPVCPTPDGLLEVFGPDGASVGYVHGLDPATLDEPVVAVPAVAPACPTQVGATDNYAVAIYARAVDDLD